MDDLLDFVFHNKEESSLTESMFECLYNLPVLPLVHGKFGTLHKVDIIDIACYFV